MISKRSFQSQERKRYRGYCDAIKESWTYANLLLDWIAVCAEEENIKMITDHALGQANDQIGILSTVEKIGNWRLIHAVKTKQNPIPEKIWKTI